MRKWLIGLFVLLAAYIGYPYLTLYWLDHALLTGDTAALESLVDFPQVRQTLKADVKLALIDQAQTQAGQGKILGIFGAALTALLVPTLVDSVVDDVVAPEKIINSEEVKKRRQEQKSFARFRHLRFLYLANRVPCRFPRPQGRQLSDGDGSDGLHRCEMARGRA